jgi:hypothetical protein
LLDSEVNVALYVKLETIYSKLETEERISFIEQIKELVKSHELMNSGSFNSMLLFFEFLVNLLTFVIFLMILGDKEQSQVHIIPKRHAPKHGFQSSRKH